MILDTFFLLCISSIAAIGVNLWWRLIKSEPGQRQTYLDRVHPTPVGMLDFVVAFAIWLGVPSIALSLLPFEPADLEKLDSTQQNVMLVAIATAQLVGCGLILLYLSVVRYGSLDWLINLKQGLAKQFVLASKAFCMIVPFILGIQSLLSLMIPYEHDTLTQLSENFSVLTMFATWYGAVLAAPLCEELVFRGVLQSWLQRIYVGRHEQNHLSEFVGGWAEASEMGVESTKSAPAIFLQFRWWFPIIVSSAVFAVIHIGQGAAPIPLFLFAIGLGFLFRYSGSLVPSVILHFMLNAFTMFWLTLQLIFENVNGVT